MKIGTVNINIPIAEYGVDLQCTKPRTATAFEWLVLEVLSKAKNEGKIKHMTFRDVFTNIFLIDDIEGLLKPCINNLINMHVIDGPFLLGKDSLSSTLIGAYEFTAIGIGFQSTGKILGEPWTEHDSILLNLFDNVVISDKKGIVDKPVSSLIPDVGTRSDFPNKHLLSYDDYVSDEFDEDESSEEISPCQAIIDELRSDSPIAYHHWKKPGVVLAGNPHITSLTYLWKSKDTSLDLVGSSIRLVPECTDKRVIDVIAESIDDLGVDDVVVNLIPSKISDISPEADYCLCSNIVSSVRNLLLKEPFIAITSQVYDLLSSSLSISKTFKDKTIYVFDSDTFSLSKDTNTIVKIPCSMPIDGSLAISQKGQDIRVGKYRIDFYGSAQSIALLEERPNRPLLDIMNENISDYVQISPMLLLIYAMENNGTNLGKMLKLSIDKMDSINPKIESLISIKGAFANYYNRKLDVSELVASIVESDLTAHGRFVSLEEFTTYVDSLRNFSIFSDKNGYLFDVMPSIMKQIGFVQRYQDLDPLFTYLRSARPLSHSWISSNAYLDQIYSQSIIRDSIVEIFKCEIYPEDKIYTKFERSLVELFEMLQKTSVLLNGFDWLKIASEDDLKKAVINCDNLATLIDELKIYEDKKYALQSLKLSEEDLISIWPQFLSIRKNINGLNRVLSLYITANIDGKKFKNVFIIDTCAFINHPDILDCFNAGDLIRIPYQVTTELDKKKNKIGMQNHSEHEAERIAYCARMAIKNITKAQAESSERVNLETPSPELLPIGMDINVPDHQIYSVALKYLSMKPYIITDDGSFTAPASAKGIKTITSDDLYHMRKKKPSEIIDVSYGEDKISDNNADISLSNNDNGGIVDETQSAELVVESSNSDVSVTEDSTGINDSKSAPPVAKKEKPAKINKLDLPIISLDLKADVFALLIDQGYKVVRDIIPNNKVDDLKKIGGLNRDQRRHIEGVLRTKGYQVKK